MAAYPAGLPEPQQATKIQPLDTTARTDMESGAARSRRRSAARADQAAVMWNFTDAQMATFRAWFEAAESADGAAGGAAWFDVDLWMGDGGADAVEARFVGAYAFDRVAPDVWRVSATLEVR